MIAPLARSGLRRAAALPRLARGYAEEAGSSNKLKLSLTLPHQVGFHAMLYMQD